MCSESRQEQCILQVFLPFTYLGAGLVIPGEELFSDVKSPQNSDILGGNRLGLALNFVKNFVDVVCHTLDMEFIILSTQYKFLI